MSENKYERSQYDSVFAAVLRSLTERKPRRYVVPNIAKLLELPRGRQVMRVRSLHRLHNAKAADHLRAASDEHRFANPPLALHLAELAVYAARPATQQGWVTTGGFIERDVLADCLATLGNAQRITGDTKAARKNLREAAQIARLGTGDPLLKAKVEWLSAVLLTDCGHLDQALALFKRSHKGYQRLDEGWRANRVLASMGRVYLRLGQPAAALRCAYDCLKETHTDGDRMLKLSSLTLIAQARLDLGELATARRTAQILQRVYQGPADRAAAIRGEWIEARALLAMGRWEEAVGGLDEARERLLKVGALADAAHAHLELALAHADACHWRQAREIARQAFGALAAAGLEGQALLALRTVARAADGEELTSKVLRRALAQLNAGG